MRQCAFFTVLCFLITSGLTFTARAGGKLVYQNIYSDALKNNLLGDAAYRSVIVYLPPGYDQSQKRYPTIYLLHGYNDTNTIWRDGFFQGFSIPPVMDRLIEQGKIQEMIVVMPDGRNAYGGSYYINSSVTGKWEDFIVKDLLEFIDQNYRTLPSNESRGIAGHSMGGYGAIFLAARYPDIYSAVYGLSACCLSMLGDVTSSNPAWVPTLQLRSKEELVGAGMYINAFTSLAAAMSPNPKNKPLLVDFPFKLLDSSVVSQEKVFKKWRMRFPVDSIDKFAEGFARLQSIGFDAGENDPITHIPLGSQSLSKALSQRGLKHFFELYQGDHTNRIGKRLEEKVLPFFSEALKSDGQRQ